MRREAGLTAWRWTWRGSKTADREDTHPGLSVGGWTVSVGSMMEVLGRGAGQRERKVEGVCAGQTGNAAPP